jgi:limonene-1,2-epoxide hydrolase
MTTNEEIIEKFYLAFAAKDVKTMQDNYGEEVVFNDAVFVDLNGDETKAMWGMLLSRSADLNVKFSKVAEQDGVVKASWEARYTFSGTGKKVVNRVEATFELIDGKIVSHTDDFDFYKWARQAFGFGGFLLGWTNVFKARVRQTAKAKLNSYMQKTNQ